MADERKYDDDTYNRAENALAAAAAEVEKPHKDKYGRLENRPIWPSPMLCLALAGVMTAAHALLSSQIIIYDYLAPTSLVANVVFLVITVVARFFLQRILSLLKGAKLQKPYDGSISCDRDWYDYGSDPSPLTCKVTLNPQYDIELKALYAGKAGLLLLARLSEACKRLAIWSAIALVLGTAIIFGWPLLDQYMSRGAGY